jgi:predicted Zn-dependent protease
VGLIKSVQAIFVTTAVLCLAAHGAAAEQGQNQDPEVQLGKETFDELKVRAEIIESSPLYDQLKPIADAITKAAQPRYNHPFKFYLVHEAQPNAFAAPGGKCTSSTRFCISQGTRTSSPGPCVTKCPTRSIETA